MRLLSRNRQPLWYANYKGKSEMIDEWGNSTGQYEITYSNPEKAMWNVNVVESDAEVEMFGVHAVDTIVITVNKADMMPSLSKNSAVCGWTRCGMAECGAYAMNDEITETTVLWYDIKPDIDEDGKTDTPHNYRIVGIRKSLNFAKIYARRVDVQ